MKQDFTLYLAATPTMYISKYYEDYGRRLSNEHQIDILSSQFNEKQFIKDGISNNWFKGKLMIDSGAFSAWNLGNKKGKDIHVDVDEYIEFINEYGDNFDVIVQVDAVTGKDGLDEGHNEKQIATWENFLYMRSKIRKDLWPKFIPVVHGGDTWDFLDLVLNYVDEDGKYLEYIALAGPQNVQANRNTNWWFEAFSRIEKSPNPNVKTHGLGMTTLDLLDQLPLTSADSSSWNAFGRYGSIVTPFGTISISDRKLNRPDNYNHLPEVKRNQIDAYLKELGSSPEKCLESIMERNYINILYYHNYAKRKRNTSIRKNVHRKKLF